MTRVVWALGLLLACNGGGAGGDGESDASSGGDDGWRVTLEVDESVGSFLSAWGPAPDLAYAVGGQRSEDSSAGIMYRYDGTTWSPASLPTGTSPLNWVFGVGDRRFTVGELGTILYRDGDEPATPWIAGGCVDALPMWGVWGAAPDAVWAVGGDAVMGDPVLCFFDGETWVAQAVPELQVESHALFKVWGTSADHVFAVGDAGVILHYDGTAWTEQDSGTAFDLISLWGRGPSEILAVGGRANGAIVRYDGTGWTATEFVEVLGLNGVWMDGTGRATVVGSLGNISLVAPGGMELVREPSNTFDSLHAVFGLPGGERVAVGGNFDSSPPYHGVIVQR